METHISRSEQKRRHKRLQKIVADLLDLSKGEQASLPVSEDIRKELLAGRSLKGGARKRQIKYVVKLLYREGFDELITYIDAKKGTEHQRTKDFHELEYLRNFLLDEAVAHYRECEKQNLPWEPDRRGSALDETRNLLPEIDMESVQKLTWLFASSRKRRYARELFRLLRGAKEQQNFDRKR